MSWIKTISSRVNNLFKNARTPIQSIPPILMLCEIYRRPGLSAMALASQVIRRQEVTDDYCPCGIANVNNRVWKIIAEEVVKHIKDYGIAKCTINMGDIQFQCIIGETTMSGSNLNTIGIDGIGS